MKKVLLSVMLVFLVVMSGCRLSSLRDPIVPPDDDQDIPETPQPYVVDNFEGYSSATEVEAIWKTTNTHNEITTEFTLVPSMDEDAGTALNVKTRFPVAEAKRTLWLSKQLLDPVQVSDYEKVRFIIKVSDKTDLNAVKIYVKDASATKKYTWKVGKDIEVGQWMTGDIPIDLLAQGLTEIHAFYFIVERNISSEPVSIDITLDEITFIPMEPDL